VTVLPSPRRFGPQTKQITLKIGNTRGLVFVAKILVPLTALSQANGDFLSRGWKILISQFSE